MKNRALSLGELVRLIQERLDLGAQAGEAAQHLERAERELQTALRSLGGAVPGDK